MHSASGNTSPPIVNRYTRHDKHGITLIDPADNKPINSALIAAWITQDDYYHQGIKLLQRYSADYAMTILFGTHRDAESFGGIQTMHRAIAAHDIFVPEELYWDQQTLDDFNEVASRDDITDASGIDAYRFEGVYVNDLLKALAGTHTTVEMIDMNDTDLTRNTELRQYNEAWRAIRASGKNADPEALVLMLTIMVYYREWIMLAKLGHALQKHHAATPKNGRMSVLMSIGALHYTLAAKLEAAGVRYTPDHPFISDDAWRTIVRRAELMNAYRYSDADIREMIALFA